MSIRIYLTVYPSLSHCLFLSLSQTHTQAISHCLFLLYLSLPLCVFVLSLSLSLYFLIEPSPTNDEIEKYSLSHFLRSEIATGSEFREMQPTFRKTLPVAILLFLLRQEKLTRVKICRLLKLQ